MQTSLNLSLARVLHVYGDHAALLADRNPPSPINKIRLYRPTSFSAHHNQARYSSCTSLQKLNTPIIFCNLHTTTLDSHMRYTTHAFKMDLQTDPLPHMASQPSKNRERAFRNMMKTIVSDLWKGQLHNAAHIPSGQPLGRKASYVHIARDDLQRFDLLKPAQFLRAPNNQLHFFDFESKPSATVLLTSTSATLTPIARMPNHIAPHVFL